MAKINKAVQRCQDLFNQAKTNSRVQWEYINQKGYDFANDNQLSESEKRSLEEQGMPTFTINRIIPVVEMLNFYATAKSPRWQAVGTEGSDSDVAAVFADVADYVWYNSSADVLYSNAVNDAITKSIGYLLVTVDPDADRGMGEVIIQQPDPFDIYVDEKSRDILFKDAAYVLIRKVLPKSHLATQFPDSKRKIMAASSLNNSYEGMSEKSTDTEQKDFHYKDMNGTNSLNNEEENELVEFFECYEKFKISYVNVFYKIPPSPEKQKQIVAQAKEMLAQMTAETEVELLELVQKLEEAVANGDMLPERMELEIQKEKQMMQDQLKSFEIETRNKLQAEAEQIENSVVSKKEFDVMVKDATFASRIVESIPFKEDRIKLTCVIGDKLIYSKPLPINEYPIVPIHYKWTGTPYPISAVSPLIGKQRELNKAHQLMVHNASLGSSLRYMFEEGSIDTDYWEQYSSAPGALLPVRNGYTPPTPVMPFQLNNAFFSLTQAGKGDMEYLAGIYSSMQGDTSSSPDMPYRGMLAMDEYGTRRIKYWLKNSVEPSLKQVGEVVKQLTQAVYTANKVFTIVQPNNINEEKTVEINVPIYNDFGHVIGKYKDYQAAKFDVRIIGGSTLPVNRWAYLEELKQLMQLGVVDDMAVLAETDIKNKEAIVKRKSLYAQLQGKIAELEEQAKNSSGTIETLERQVVQSGIKNKIMQGDMEVNKQTLDSKHEIKKEELETKARQKFFRNALQSDVKNLQNDMKKAAKDKQNNLK